MAKGIDHGWAKLDDPIYNYNSRLTIGVRKFKPSIKGTEEASTEESQDSQEELDQEKQEEMDRIAQEVEDRAKQGFI